jgi:hypothetical protein
MPLQTNKGRSSGINLDNIYSNANEANDVSVNSVVTTAMGERGGNIKIQNLVKNANSALP